MKPVLTQATVDTTVDPDLLNVPIVGVATAAAVAFVGHEELAVYNIAVAGVVGGDGNRDACLLGTAAEATVDKGADVECERHDVERV